MTPAHSQSASHGPSTTETSQLQLGPIQVWPPVVLAPMAGVTDYPFRNLCRRFGAGLYVSEMITAKPLVMGNAKTLKLASFGSEERPRSLQLYGVDPGTVGEAVSRLVEEARVDHIDMNFGCPVRKVTRKGGGAALPLKRPLLRAIVRAAVQNAGNVPVTIKFRMGIDDNHLTYLDTGRIAEEEGCKAVSLHARTAAQLYDGEARWEAIAQLKQAVSTIPVLGNGDIWEASDAMRMMAQTGCDGVVVGRGCLGRPWLFRDLACAFDRRPAPTPPNFGEVCDIMAEHASALASWFGESYGIRSFRRHASWYTKGFRNSAKLRKQLMQATTVAEVHDALAALGDRSEPFPPHAHRVPRGKTSGTQRVALPEGYLDQLDSSVAPLEELAGSGG